MMMMCYMMVTSDEYDLTNYDYGGYDSSVNMGGLSLGAHSVNAIATCTVVLVLGDTNHAAAQKVMKVGW